MQIPRLSMVNSVVLRNFKCFKQHSFSLGQLSLFTGLNSAGKSTLLQALILLRQSYLMQTLPKRGLLLNGSLLQLGTSEGILHKGADEDVVGISVTSGSESVDWNFAYDGPNKDLLTV